MKTEIIITSIKTPEVGWPVLLHCPLCGRSEIVLSLWAIKPERGDYFWMEKICIDDEMHHQHNMRFAIEPVRPKGIYALFEEGERWPVKNGL